MDDAVVNYGRFAEPMRASLAGRAVIIVIVAYLMGMLISACSLFIPNGDHTSMPSIAPDQRVRMLALGDSYTIGEGVAKADRWPAQLADLLRAQGYQIDELNILAQTGWTTGDLAAAIREAELEPPYDLVSLLIGVNNQYRGYSRDDYRQEFSQLLAQAVAFAGGDSRRVLVLSIPDWGVTPYAAGSDRAAIAADIDAFNAVNRQIAEERGVNYVDVTQVSRRAGEDETLLASDGLHPSGKMYAEWARLVLPAALEALQSGE